MSLRSQIHRAIDDVASPGPALERRVEAFVMGDDGRRLRLRSRPQPRWTAPLGLIAAALVLSLVAGLIIAGRFWQTQNAAPATVSQTELKRLESRPLNYPVVAAGAACPVTSATLNHQIGMVIGNGPVYLYNGDLYETNDWGLWVAMAFASDSANPGLVLIRAKDLKRQAQIAFAKYPLTPTPMTAAGAVLGTSRVADHVLQMRSEAVVPDPSTWPTYPKLGKHVEVVVLFGMQTGSSGCIGFQMDAPGFSEDFVVQPGVPEF